jgi:hypothetical protein
MHYLSLCSADSEESRVLSASKDWQRKFLLKLVKEVAMTDKRGDNRAYIHEDFFTVSHFGSSAINKEAERNQSTYSLQCLPPK